VDWRSRAIHLLNVRQHREIYTSCAESGKFVSITAFPRVTRSGCVIVPYEPRPSSSLNRHFLSIPSFHFIQSAPKACLPESLSSWSVWRIPHAPPSSPPSSQNPADGSATSPAVLTATHPAHSQPKASRWSQQISKMQIPSSALSKVLVSAISAVNDFFSSSPALSRRRSSILVRQLMNTVSSMEGATP
jgi:hypothetical protein